MNQDQAWDVIVIGAGMAGLAAGRMLAEAGQKVLVLEAAQRAGGRIRTVRHGEVSLELGAEFIHGRPPELWALIEEAGLETYERTGTMLEAATGGLREAEGGGDLLDGLQGYNGPDQPFLSYVDSLGLEEHDRQAAIGYAEGYNAAVAAEASTIALGRQQEAEDAIEGDRVWKIRGGYDQLPAYLVERLLAAGGQILFNHRVEAVDWTPGQATLRAGQRTFTAKHCILTLPLGVLQTRSVRFSPEPLEALGAMERMRMGQVFRMSLLFRERFWPEDMSFLLTREQTPPVWWTSHPEPAAILTAWAGGPGSASLLHLPQAERLTLILQHLAQTFAVSEETLRANLIETCFDDWQADPSTHGAYSWVPVGGLGAAAMLSKPVENTLFFAGEHTDKTGHWGTVHAALASGLRAAKQVLGKAWDA